MSDFRDANFFKLKKSVSFDTPFLLSLRTNLFFCSYLTDSSSLLSFLEALRINCKHPSFLPVGLSYADPQAIFDRSYPVYPMSSVQS